MSCNICVDRVMRMKELYAFSRLFSKYQSWQISQVAALCNLQWCINGWAAACDAGPLSQAFPAHFHICWAVHSPHDESDTQLQALKYPGSTERSACNNKSNLSPRAILFLFLCFFWSLCVTASVFCLLFHVLFCWVRRGRRRTSLLKVYLCQQMLS